MAKRRQRTGLLEGYLNRQFLLGLCVIELPDVMIFIGKRTAPFEERQSIASGFAKDLSRSVLRQRFRKLSHAHLRPMPKFSATFEFSFAR
jgi:hypothetical protein